MNCSGTYDIASVLTDSPIQENLEFLSDENNLTSTTMGVISLHGRNTSKDHYWYDYLYSKEELLPWVTKIKKDKTTNRICFCLF